MGYSNLITRCCKAPKPYFLSPFFVSSTNIHTIKIIITQLFQYCQQYTRRKKHQKKIEICHGSIKKNNSKRATLLNLFTIYIYVLVSPRMFYSKLINSIDHEYPQISRDSYFRVSIQHSSGDMLVPNRPKSPLFFLWSFFTGKFHFLSYD